MSGLTAAHRGYEYQDLLAAIRLVDVCLGRVTEALVDQKLVDDDRFDDLTTVDVDASRIRAQIKHTDRNDRPLSLETFTTDSRSLRLDRLVTTILRDRDGPGTAASSWIFRVVLRDLAPVDDDLIEVLRPALPDPGPFVPAMRTTRLSFDAEKIWAQFDEEDAAFAPLRTYLPTLTLYDLTWACDRMIVEVESPAASGDLTQPGPAELILLDRVRREVGAEAFPNLHRDAVDVSDAFVTAARAARQGRLRVTAEELLRRAHLRTDFGTVAKAHPVDRETQVERSLIVDQLLAASTELAETGGRLVVTGPPGQGKSWVCQQLLERMSSTGWIVAEHYCFLGDADGERTERVLSEHLFGSLVARLAEADPALVEHHRPRFGADENALAHSLQQSQQPETSAPVALIVDGLDHITRVRMTSHQTANPSLTVAEALQSIELPAGCVMIVLSQPGEHLTPLMNDVSVQLDVPGLDASELRHLAERHGVVSGSVINSGGSSALLDEQEVIEDFLSALEERSKGNALYATYLCREVLRDRLIADAASAVRDLPAFDGTLEAYYRYLLDGVGPDAGWVAEIVAATNFGIRRHELREIIPQFAHRVDEALRQLSPVLEEKASQGVRVYHESLARFVRQGFSQEPSALTSLLLSVADWLEAKGLFTDSRAYRNLFPLLIEAGQCDRVVGLVGLDFVERSISAAFPASAVTANLAWAVRAAEAAGRWPELVRYVELSRAAEAFQDERYDSVLVDFADVYIALLGTDVVADRMLDEGRRVVPARAGMQMCAALDRLGGVAPWFEYMVGYLRESAGENVSYGADSDRRVAAAWLRGKLRLRSSDSTSRTDSTEEADTVLAKIDWRLVAEWLEDNASATADLVESILDSHGADGIGKLILESERPGPLCLVLAEATNTTDLVQGVSSRSWATAALAHGAGHGTVHRLLGLGVDVKDIALDSLDQARSRLLEVTHQVQQSDIQFESGTLLTWLDLLAVASRREPTSLDLVDIAIVGDGWYRCWLHFVVGLVRAEVAPPENQSELALAALDCLSADLRPYKGEPRSCDLYRIHAVIAETVERSIRLLDGEHWEAGLLGLRYVSEQISTTLSGEIGGPVPADLVLDLTVRTATEDNYSFADNLLDEEIRDGAASRYYSDLPSHYLYRARLALAANDKSMADEHWRQACVLMGAYGWRKDITIYELLNPLETLISADPERGRRAVAAVQGLCERVPMHTDGKETNGAPERWWKLLAQADPVCLADLAATELLESCNDPNELLFRALDELWRATTTTSDAIASAALRVSIDSPLEADDAVVLERLLKLSDEQGEAIPRLAIMTISRHDERPVEYSFSNGSEILASDDARAALATAVARKAGMPYSIHFRDPPRSEDDSGSRGQATHSTRFVDPPPPNFGPGTVGLSQAIRAWRNRPYHAEDSGWSEERFVAAIGYRLLELAQDGRDSEVRNALDTLADAMSFGDRSELLVAIADGLDRHDFTALSAQASTLAWTRTRGHGGWLSFGGETRIELLERASALSPDVTSAVLADEVARFVAGARVGTYGISQALIYAFATGSAGVPNSLDVAFEMWDETHAVISARAPIVHELDEPLRRYSPRTEDTGTPTQSDLDGALGIALAAGMAHGSRERKRRTLTSISLLIELRPEIAAKGISYALSAECDPATHEWVLGILQAHATNTTLIRACGDALTNLVQSPYLAVRSTARRLLSSDAPLALPGSPDPSLMTSDEDADWSSGSSDERHASANVLHYAGARISSGVAELPGLGDVVRSNVIEEMKGESYKSRKESQTRAFADLTRSRWSDAYLAKEQLVEENLQRVAGSGRAARLIAGEPVESPETWEDDLGNLLLDDPQVAIILESTRRPRPNIPPLPAPHSDWWRRLPTADNVWGYKDEDHYSATIAVCDPEALPMCDGWPIDGWIWLATVEERTFPHPDWARRSESLAAVRYRVAEIRVNEDERALTRPPVATGDLALWRAQVDPRAFDGFAGSQPIVSIDRQAALLGDLAATLGAPGVVLMPTVSLIASLQLRPIEEIGYADESGPALVPAIWRADYDRSDYHLPMTQTVGAGIAIRRDLLAQLGDLADGQLVLRDFLRADADLLSPDTVGS